MTVKPIMTKYIYIFFTKAWLTAALFLCDMYE